MFGKVGRTEIIIDKTNTVSIIRLTMLVYKEWELICQEQDYLRKK